MLDPKEQISYEADNSSSHLVAVDDGSIYLATDENGQQFEIIATEDGVVEGKNQAIWYLGCTKQLARISELYVHIITGWCLMIIIGRYCISVKNTQSVPVGNKKKI